MTELNQLLTDFEEAIEEDERKQVADGLDQLDAAFEKMESTEARLSAQARSVRRDQPLEPAQAETLAAYDGTLGSVELARGALLAVGSMYVVEPEEIPATEVRQVIEQLQEFNSELKEQSDDVRQVLTSLDVPASLVVSASPDEGPYLKGQKTTISLTIKNVGTEPATAVSLEVDSQASATPKKVNLGDLKPEDEITEPVTIQFKKAQQTTVSFEITSESGGDSEEELSFTVADKKALAEGALDIVAAVRDRIRDNESITGGQENSLVSQLEAAKKSLQRTLEEINDDRSQQANNALNTATRQLGAFLNHFDARQNGRWSVEDSNVFSITTQVEGAIENAAKAKDAEI